MSNFKILLILVLVGIIPSTLAAVISDTPAGSIITNEVTASYSNAVGNNYSATSTVTTNVYEIYGISTTFTNSTNAYTAPTNQVDFKCTVLNEGNTSQIVFFTNLLEKYGNGAGPWTIQFLNDGLNNATSMTLGEDQERTFWMRVSVPAAALFGQTMTNDIAAYFTNTGRFSTITGYTGMNSTNYGGLAQSDSRLSIIIIQAPVIDLTKLTYVSNSPSYLALGGGLRDVVPGSEITYAIQFTNSGNIAALGLTISDTLPADAVYVTSTMAYRDNAQTDASPTSYAAALPLTDGPINDALGAFSIEGDETAVADTIIFTFGNPIASGDRGTVYFKVYIK